MAGYTVELGELQQSILKHIFECTSKSENANHIAKALGSETTYCVQKYSVTSARKLFGVTTELKT